VASESLEFIATARDEASGVISGLQAKLKSLGPASSGATSSIGGLSTGMLGVVGASVGAAFAIAGVAEGVGRMAADFIQAALDEQQSISNLDQALKNNVTNWDGNTMAVESYIQQLENTGYSAQDLRQGLSQLVGTTKDVTSAETDLSLATDIARGKNIDLTTAITDLQHLAAGNWKRTLVSLGVSTQGVTDATGALDAIMTQFGGDAAAYTQTTSGQMDVMKNKAHDMSVEIGNDLMPGEEAYVNFLSEALIPALGNATSAFGSFLDSFGDRRSLGGASQMGVLIKTGVASLAAQGPAISDMMTNVMTSGAGKIFAALAGEGKKLGQDVADAYAAGLTDTQDSVQTAWKGLLTAEKNPASAAKQIAQVQGELNSKALAKGLASSDPDIVARAEALQATLEQRLTELQTFAGLRGAGIDNALANGITNNLPVLTRAEDRIMQQMANRFASSPFLSFLAPPRPPASHHAAGGPFGPGEVLHTGEYGEETIYTGGQSGYVVPGRGSGSSDGVPPHSHPIYMNSRRVGDAVDQHIGKRLAMASDGDYSRG
jgi:hypothetical protein